MNETPMQTRIRFSTTNAGEFGPYPIFEGHPDSWLIDETQLHENPQGLQAKLAYLDRGKHMAKLFPAAEKSAATLYGPSGNRLKVLLFPPRIVRRTNRRTSRQVSKAYRSAIKEAGGPYKILKGFSFWRKAVDTMAYTFEQQRHA